MKFYLVLKGSPFAPLYLGQPRQGPTGPEQEWTFHGPAAVELAEAEAQYELAVAGGVGCGVRLEKVDRPACMLCPADRPQPATAIAGDWEVCGEHFNALAAPWPEESEQPAF